MMFGGELAYLLGLALKSQTDKTKKFYRGSLAEVLSKAWDEGAHPREPAGSEEGGQFTSGGGGGGGIGGDEGERATVPVGFGVPEGSVLAKAGISVIKHADAEKVLRSIAGSTGSTITAARHLSGGWTDPESNTYYPEPTLVAEFSGKQGVTRLTADAVAHVLGPQKEVWVVNDGEKLPSARDLRLDIMPTNGVDAQQLSDVARKVDPQLFSGFTETVDANGRAGISVLVKDGIAPWRSGSSSTVVSGYGQPFEVMINPTERDVRAMIKDAVSPDGVRVILDRNDNLYVWDAYNAIHASVAGTLGLDSRDEDFWAVEKGRLVGVMFDGTHGRPTPRDVIAGVTAEPPSPAMISQQADKGLLRLVEALSNAGIDAIVLPTAVNIDKRVANGEQGYRASIEREAGVEAVIALDAYRARVASALKAGKAPPEFDIDLAKFAAEHQQVRRPRAASFDFDWSDVGDLHEKVWDESQHPRDEQGRWTDDGGDDLGTMALGGEDSNITAATRKVDALRDEMGIDEASIPFAQRQALGMYTQDSYTFNQNVRGGSAGDPASQNLDKLVGSYELPRDVTVYRTVGWQRTQSILGNLDGSFSDPAYMSTTLDKSKIDKPGSYIEIEVPKGSKAFPVGSHSNYPEEAEIVFPRNSRLQIVSHEPREAPNTVRFVARLV
jgi:hypothetical protein